MMDVIHLENAKGLGLASLELAKELKQKGFNKPTEHFWIDKDLPYLPAGLGRVKTGMRRRNHNRYDDFIYSAPTIKEANKWLSKNN